LILYAAELSREQCAEEVFDTVIKLNNNRILGRLASRLFQRPLYDRGPPRSPLTVRLKGYIASRSSTQRTSQTSADVGTLSAQINAFHASFLQLERSTVGEILSATKSLVKEAFLISVDGFSLCTRLEAMGFPASIIDTREIREVNKIANYWRICRSLAHLSRSYRLLFTRLRLETLEPYEPSSASSMKPKRFVHAEVQMIVFYETSSPPPWPRAIGASKEACFLCDSFVIAHGYFYLSKAHRQIFPQWAVPDRGDYSTSTLQRFRSALATVDQSVTEGLKNARRNRGFRPFPLQSSINLLKPMLPTPSMTTIRSSGSEIEHGVSSIGLPATSKPATQRPVTNLRNDNVLALDGVKPNEDSASPPSIDAPPLHLSASAAAGQTVADDVVTEAVEDLTTTTTTTTTTPTPSYAPIQGGPSTFPAITFTSAIHTTVDWLSLHIQLEAGAPPLGKGAPVATGPPLAFSRASVRLETVQSREAFDREWGIECFSVGDLMPGEERVITRRGGHGDDYGGRQPEIEFILMNGPRNPVRVSCRWYNS
jgi:hypothetical protein